MTYIDVKEETEDRLHLVRNPSLRSWAILAGLISVGLGAAYYSGDYFLWKMVYVSGTVFIGLTCMEDWEECILDKTTKKITTKRVSLIQRLFQAEQGQKIIVGDLDDCLSVSVQQEEVKYAGTGHSVVLYFGSGYSLSVTEMAVISDKTDQDYIANKIQNFLGLDKNETNQGTPLIDLDLSATPDLSSKVNLSPVVAMETTPEADVAEVIMASQAADSPAGGASVGSISSSDSDDSFEQIDKAELVNMCELDNNLSEGGATGPTTQEEKIPEEQNPAEELREINAEDNLGDNTEDIVASEADTKASEE